MSPAEKTLGREVDNPRCWRGTLPRGSRFDAERLQRPSCTGWTKPIASSTSCASISNSLPESALNLSSTCTPMQFCSPGRHCPRSAGSAGVVRAWRLRPGSRTFPHLQRPVRPGRPLFSCSGGAGMISSWVTESAPCRNEVLPMQSEPGVRRRAVHDHMLGRRRESRTRRPMARC